MLRNFLIPCIENWNKNMQVSKEIGPNLVTPNNSVDTFFVVLSDWEQNRSVNRNFYNAEGSTPVLAEEPSREDYSCGEKTKLPFLPRVKL